MSADFDYYEVLNLKRNCSQEAIAEAYRRLALEYHPKVTTPEKAAINEYKFQQIAEAYEVLSDSNKKNIYDIYGKDGLYNGILDKHNHKTEPYKFSGNAHKIFEKFFGTSNPFALIKDGKKNIESEYSAVTSNFEKKEEEKKTEELPPIDVELYCTLEELYNGCTKTVKYKKCALSLDKRSQEEKECSIDVEILPGYDKTTVIPFKELGNEAPGKKTSDLLIHIRECNNPCFKRVNKNDLIYIHKLNLADALNSEPVKLTTLDNRKIAISMDEIIAPQTIKIVKNEGMPIYQKETNVRDMRIKKGDLYIKFDIEFPEYINPEKKEEIIKLLDEE
jgi:DnaJ-class molecular chaperone